MSNYYEFIATYKNRETLERNGWAEDIVCYIPGEKEPVNIHEVLPNATSIEPGEGDSVKITFLGNLIRVVK